MLFITGIATIIGKIGILVVLALLGVFEDSRVEIVEETQSRTGIIIVQVSDLHIGRRIRRVHRKSARIVNRLEPDILVITGDSTGSPDHVKNLSTWLESLNTENHRFAVLGNWEYAISNPTQNLRRVYEDSGVQLLVNESVDLEIGGRALRITGLDDLLGGRPDYSLPGAAVKGVPEIVLVHEPAAADHLADSADELIILSGHTHGGQVRLFGRTLYTPRGSGSYIDGFYKVGGNRLFVSKGLGTSTLNIRLGPRPDILVLQL